MVVALGCATGESPSDAPSGAVGEVVLPDTQTIDGVLVMRHGADAFDRAPVWFVDSVPEVVIDGGEEPDFDLTSVFRPARFADGRYLASPALGGGRLMLFKADGTPERLVARSGRGPGDVRTPGVPIPIDGDTMLVLDGGNRRLAWVTADGGVVRESGYDLGLPAFCFQPTRIGTSDRYVATLDCAGRSGADTGSRPGRPIWVFDTAFTSVDSVGWVPAFEYAMMETRYRGQEGDEWLLMRYGRRAWATGWGDELAVATGADGYVIERWRPDGGVTSRIEVAVPRRPVTRAMIQALVDRDLEGLSGRSTESTADAEESRRIARETPAADSLPPFQALIPSDDGLLWVVDGQAVTDSTWSATAFRPDGAIVGRVTSHRMGRPLWFNDGTVMVREVDGDGVVRFGVWQVRQR